MRSIPIAVPLVLVAVLAIPVAAPAAAPAPRSGSIPWSVVVGFEALPEDPWAWAEAVGASVVRVNPDLRYLSLEASDGNGDRVIAAALELPSVRYAVLDGWMSAAFTPNDPRYGSQWAPPVIALPAAWDHGLGTRAVKIAILDSGVDGRHPDLAANFCGQADFTSGGALADHGTHVAGIAAASIDNGVGIAGASNSCIYDGRVLGPSGSGAWEWLAAGITWAQNRGVHIISMSLGGFGSGPFVRDAVQRAHAAGILLVAAAGNAGCRGGPGPTTAIFGEDSQIEPGSMIEVMAIASLADSDKVSSFSSCGHDVEIAAPGGNILSTLTNNRYGSMSGTSMATPYVSGVAALVLASHPGLTELQLRCTLLFTAEPVQGQVPVFDKRVGFGRLDAEKAILSPVTEQDDLDLCVKLQELRERNLFR